MSGPMSGQPVAIDLAGAANSKFIISIAIDGALIALMLLRILFSGPALINVALLAFGVLAMGVLVIRRLTGAGRFRPRRIIVEPGGIRWEQDSRPEWAVSWNELAAIGVWAGRTTGAGTLSPSIGNVKIQMYPADAGFASRHPQLAAQWQAAGSCYQLDLPAVAADTSARLDAGLRGYAGARYRGTMQANTYR